MFSIFFWSVCRRRNASFLAVDTPAVVSVLGTRSKDFRIPWIAALVVAAFCAIMLASCYHWWCKPTATGESQPLNLQRRGLPSKAREEQKPSRRHSSSLRRLSSRDSPNGWSLNFTSFFLLDDDVGSHILCPTDVGMLQNMYYLHVCPANSLVVCVVPISIYNISQISILIAQNYILLHIFVLESEMKVLSCQAKKLHL